MYSLVLRLSLRFKIPMQVFKISSRHKNLT